MEARIGSKAAAPSWWERGLKPSLSSGIVAFPFKLRHPVGSLPHQPPPRHPGRIHRLDRTIPLSRSLPSEYATRRCMSFTAPGPAGSIPRLAMSATVASRVVRPSGAFRSSVRRKKASSPRNAAKGVFRRRDAERGYPRRGLAHATPFRTRGGPQSSAQVRG